MLFSDILADTYRRLNFASSPDSAVSTRIKAVINEYHRRILSTPGISQLRDDVTTFASVASTYRYALPQAIARIRGIHERTNDRVLEERSMQWWREQQPDPTDTGTPEVYVPAGLNVLATDLSAAGGLWIVSDSASDGGSTTVYIEGVKTGGYRATVNTTMNGTTRKQIGTATDWIDVTNWYINVAAVGNVSLYDAATSGNELARIAPGRTTARYQTIYLWPTPASVITYHVDYTRQVTDLSVNQDEPLLPDDFCWLLTAAARMCEYEKKDDSRYALTKREYEDGVRALRLWLYNTPDYLPTPGIHETQRSRLGAWYPAGT